jgi:flagellar hook-associated protein FlgK
VNVDQEIVRLTQLQNNYSATARVLSTIQNMLEMLDRF